MKTKFSKKSGPVKSKKVIYDGITFASGLEKYMYELLKKSKIDCKYEGETFHLLDDFHFNNSSFERQSNGKGDYINRGNKKILSLKYTPDFTSYDFIIETKGRANESFPLRWKLFKKFMCNNNDNRILYKPQTKSECEETIRLILLERSKKQKKDIQKDNLTSG
jgi:hypothetical protein